LKLLNKCRYRVIVGLTRNPKSQEMLNQVQHDDSAVSKIKNQK